MIQTWIQTILSYPIEDGQLGASSSTSFAVIVASLAGAETNRERREQGIVGRCVPLPDIRERVQFQRILVIGLDKWLVELFVWPTCLFYHALLFLSTATKFSVAVFSAQ